MLIGYLRALRWAQQEMWVRTGRLSGGTGWSGGSSGSSLRLLMKTWGWKNKAPLWLPCALVSQVMGGPGQWAYEIRVVESPKPRQTISSWSLMFSSSTYSLSASWLLSLSDLAKGVWTQRQGKQSSPDCWTSSSIWFWPEILVKKSMTGQEQTETRTKVRIGGFLWI